MKKNKFFFIAVLLLLGPITAKSQVVISLLLGDALNTPKIEFGLAGGLSHSYIKGIEGSKGLNSLDLGFYFHIRLKENSFLSTGLHVKSTMGATGMPTYPIGNADFDSVYKDGTLTKKIPVFYVPIMWQQRFNNRWYIEAGPMLGLVHKPKDVFEVSEFDGNLTYTTTVMDQYKRIDAGIQAGVGYKFRKELKSMSAGVSYYYGFVDLSKNPDITIKNSTWYFFIRIPIGVNGKDDNENNKSNK
jgi:hypothetical protein